MPPLATGTGERFAWHIDQRGIVVEGVVLALSAPGWRRCCWSRCSSFPAIAAYWKYRFGGVTGDCLGAGIEVTETLLLLLIAVQMA